MLSKIFSPTAGHFICVTEDWAVSGNRVLEQTIACLEDLQNIAGNLKYYTITWSHLFDVPIPLVKRAGELARWEKAQELVLPEESEVEHAV